MLIGDRLNAKLKGLETSAKLVHIQQLTLEK